jgi:hypothetical protein
MIHIGISLTRHRLHKILNQQFILLYQWVIWMPMMGQYSMPINNGGKFLNGEVVLEANYLAPAFQNGFYQISRHW